MRTLTRTLAYSLCLIVFLGYVSYRIYCAPSQMKSRIEGYIGRFLSGPAHIEGCRADLLGPLTVERLEVSSVPPIDERVLLELSGLRLEAASSRRIARWRSLPQLEAAALTLRVRSARLCLDRLKSDAKGKIAWNFRDAIRFEPLLEGLAGEPAHVTIERLSVQLQDLEPPREKRLWTMEGHNVEVWCSAETGIHAEADLAESEAWSEGWIRLSWSREKGLLASGELEEARGAERWLPFLTETRAIWETLNPTGSWNVDIDAISMAQDGGVSFRAIVGHYDTTIRLGVRGPELRHLSGPMLATETGVAFGKEAAGGVARAELLGVGVEVDGRLEKARGEIRLVIPRGPIGAMPALAVDAVKDGALAPSLQVQGILGGQITADIEVLRGARLQGKLDLEDIAFAGVPAVSRIKGTLTFEPAEGASGLLAGRGKLRLDEGFIEGFGPARGEVRLEWEKDSVRVEISDLRVGEAAPAGPGAPTRPEPGSVLGSLTWTSTEGISSYDLRWLELALSTKLLDARELRGELKKGPKDAAGKGNIRIGPALIPAGVLWPEAAALEFKGGQGRCSLAGGGRSVALELLKLGGERLALRARGELSFSGRLEAVVFVSQGEQAAAVEQLPDDSQPAQWKAASRDAYRVFRVTGTVASPLVREVGPLDPMFVEGK